MQHVDKDCAGQAGMDHILVDEDIGSAPDRGNASKQQDNGQHRQAQWENPGNPLQEERYKGIDAISLEHGKIGVRHNKSAEDEEEIHSHITMRNNGGDPARAMNLRRS